MIAFDPHSLPLDPAEHFGLELLLDLSRVLRFVGQGDVVRLRIADGPVESLPSCIAAGWRIHRADGLITIPRGVLRLVTAIAGAEEEQRSALRDRFGRVPPDANALVTVGLERSPVISNAAVELRRAVIDVSGRRPVRLLVPWPEGKRWAAAFSHDLDVVNRWPAFTALRVAELLRKRELGRASSVILAAARAIGAGGRPVWDGVRAILDVESQWSVRSTWFVLCGTPTLTTMKAGDLTYRLESPAGRRIASALAGAGHEIGLHGSFETYASADRFREQRERLSHVIRQSPDGVRQHYLRMIPGETQSAMAAAGFCYDSTFGFADRNGFRLGVADVLPAWRATTPAAVAIEEVPFIWMDRALSKYRNIESPRSWVDDALELAAACQAVEGLWTGVWHPNLTPALGFPGAPDAFRMLVRELVQASPFVGTMSVLVRWRRARRTARAIASHADGSFAVECVDAGPFSLAIEDAEGRATPDAVRPAS